jgi:hypothetical protein
VHPWKVEGMKNWKAYNQQEILEDSRMLSLVQVNKLKILETFQHIADIQAEAFLTGGGF